MSDFNQSLRILSAPENRLLLTAIRRGLEKESLRVDSRGRLARTPHPRALGSALTHPRITTDYSEALLEMITPPHTSVAALLGTLDDIHRYIYHNLDNEMLWVNSMPCAIPSSDEVPVANYGTSNIGRMKTVYRLGLGHRYGRIMQTIAGIHYNWSVPEECLSLLQTASGNGLSFHAYKTQRYFDLIRNFRRYTWLLLYLFGASPAVCRTFIGDKPHQLVPLEGDANTLHSPYATSLRMGDLGYQSTAQESLHVCYNNLESYIDTLRGALTHPYRPYEAIGLKDPDGSYRQLSTNLLQIENEFYSTVRPKRTTRPGETPIRALAERGVEYIEVRCIDLNPLTPVGIDAEQIHFLDVFLLYCLMADSPLTDGSEYRDILENQKRIVYRGRDPELRLRRNGTDSTVARWGADLFAAMAPVAKLLDDANGSDCHTTALTNLERRLHDPSLTPSGRILDTLKAQGLSYFELAMEHAQTLREHFINGALDPATEAYYQQLAQKSLDDQTAIEASDALDFDAFLASYYSQYDA